MNRIIPIFGQTERPMRTHSNRSFRNGIGNCHYANLLDSYIEIPVCLRIYQITFCLFTIISGTSLQAQNNPSPFIGTNLPRGTEIYELRLAVSCPGEYTQQVGGVANAQAYIDSWLEQINVIYGREYCVRFKLIDNNDALIFADPATDPWPDKDGGGGCIGSAPFGGGVQKQVIDGIVGSESYDFSHIFYSDAMAGGCGGGFHFGVSGPPDIDVTRHEMGHQFGQDHTIENGGNNNYELQNGRWSIQGGNNHGYAHAVSYHELASTIINAQMSIGNIIATGNHIPSVDAGPDRAIPISTPFTLKGMASDQDATDQLTYIWDQMDGGIYQASPVPDDSQGPLFMRFLPSSNPSRTIPKMSEVLAGNYSTMEEHLPTQARDMNIRLTVNDNHKHDLNGTMVNASGINSDDLKITVVNTGPFTVNSPSNGTEVWNANSQVTVQWSVAGTAAAPINCSLVEISLSVDGGLTFPYILMDAIANDGSETFTLPEGVVGTTEARIKVESDNFDNVRFFDISNQNFTINSDCSAFGGIIIPASSISADEGDQVLNLNLSTEFYQAPSVFTFDVDQNDPLGISAEFDGDKNCRTVFNRHYSTYKVKVDRPGKYTIFPKFVGGLYTGFFTLYAGDYDPEDACTNFLTSNTTSDDGGTGQTESISDVILEPGITYTMVIYPWDQTATCNVSFSSIDGGLVFPAEGPNPPDGSYAYTFLAVNKTTGNVAAVSATSDFTSLSQGQYKVYGVSYKATGAPPPVVDPSGFTGQALDQVLLSHCINLSINCVELQINGEGSTPTCDDGIQNGDETGVDCGGTQCEPCDPDPCTPNTINSMDVPKTIPETGDETHTITSTINVNTEGIINDINVLNLQIDHTWVGDLNATLTSPGGVTITLFSHPGTDDPVNDAGCAGQNLLLGFDDEAASSASVLENTCGNLPAIQGSFNPIEALSAFDEINPNGTWTLTIMDVYPFADGGQLVSWSLELCTLGSTDCHEVSSPVVTGSIPAGTYFTPGQMSTGGTVNTPDVVTLISGTSVELTQNFQANLGAILTIFIDPCPEPFNKSQVPVQTNYTAKGIPDKKTIKRVNQQTK